MTVHILRGNCVELMAAMPEQSVHCCVTSPPYWGLRDYGTAPLIWPAISYSPLAGLPECVHVPAMDASLGLEPTLEAFIGHMLLVFREVRRVLRDDGTCWVNMGDSYAGSRCGGNSDAITGEGRDEAVTAKQKMRTASRRRDNEPIPRSDVRVLGLKPKDLCMQPHRLALALQADGWWVRQDVVWSKPNPMPESTRDRCTKSHEYVFHLAKAEHYYFDQDAILEPASPGTHARLSQKNLLAQAGSTRAHAGAKTNGPMKAVSRKLANAGSGTKNNDSFDAAMAVMPEFRNKRSVWSVPTESFTGAHFATFPTKLIEPCILAGCPPGGTVLDCFGGSGTTGMVADRLQRNAVLCELNASYVQLAEQRVRGDAGLFAEVQVEA